MHNGDWYDSGKKTHDQQKRWASKWAREAAIKREEMLNGLEMANGTKQQQQSQIEND